MEFGTFLCSFTDIRRVRLFNTKEEAELLTNDCNYALSLIYVEPESLARFETRQFIGGTWVLPLSNNNDSN